MYKAKNNLGIYYELNLLIDYIEDDTELNLLDELIVAFKYEGLTHKEIKSAVGLIEAYLPSFIECDNEGCYVVQDIDGVEAHTYFSEIEEQRQDINVHKPLLLV